MFFMSDSSSDSENQHNVLYLRRERKLLRQRRDIFNLPDGTSSENFRLNKSAYKYVLETITPVLETTTRTSTISKTVKLATTLRFLAQGSYQLSVGNDFNLGFSQPAVSKILSEVIQALESKLCPQGIKLKMSVSEKEESKLHFYEKTEFPGVIGCVDGTHIKILAPEKENQYLYFNRKGFYSLNAMIICDHKMRIRYLDARYAGSAHDSLIWNMSSAKTVLLESYNRGERNCWLLGDAGYPLEPYLMTPYRSAIGGSPEALYNTKHAKARNIVERCIGVLKNRFRCILGARQLYYKPAKAIQIVNVCAALHNVCIDYGVEEEPDFNLEVTSNLDEGEEIGEIPEASQIREEIKRSFIN